MATKSLPYVHAFRDRHGHVRHYYRRDGRRVPLPGDYGSAKFMGAYEAELHRDNDAATARSLAAALRKDEARDAREPPSRCGVYMLIRDDRITYVGSSKSMMKRVKAHQSNGRSFDRVIWMETAPEDLLYVERLLIGTIQPPENRDVRAPSQTKRELKLANPLPESVNPPPAR